MATFVIEVPCDDGFHKIELHEDGSVRMFDHNQRTMKAFVAFQATPPRCMRFAKRWKGDFTDELYHLLDMEALGVLASEWALQVLPLFEEAFPEDHRPRNAIALAQAAAHGADSATGPAAADARSAARKANKENRLAAAYAARAAAMAADLFATSVFGNQGSFEAVQRDAALAEEEDVTQRFRGATLGEDALLRAQERAVADIRRRQRHAAIKVLQQYKTYGD